MRRWIAAACLLLAACGSSPTSPSPQPVQVPVPTPAPQPVPQPAPTVLPDPALFDATFNAQLVHNAFDAPGSPASARILHENPSIYLQTAGLTSVEIASIEAAARSVVPTWSGGALSVAAFETGPTLRPDAVGWIVIQTTTDATAPCGQSLVGVTAGHVMLNVAPELRDLSRASGCYRPVAHTIAHELGHALGFWHVADPACLMSASRPLSHNGQPCDKERYHAGLAYQSNGAYSVSAPRIIID